MQRVVLFSVFFLSAFVSNCAAAAEAAADPDMLGMRTYTQELTLNFASADDASKSTLTPSPVFDGKKWAFSARWDDNNANHERMRAAMAKHGLLGTFYINQTGAADAKGVLQYGPEYAKSLMNGGFSIGNHCQTHPFLTTMTPNEIFYEVVANRVERERQTNKPVNSFAFPYGGYSTPLNPNFLTVITQTYVRSGLHNTPYLSFTQNNPGLRPNEISATYQVVPGDKEVNPAGFDKQMDKVLQSKDPAVLNLHCISLGVHVWQSGKAWDDLDAVFAKYAQKPEFWYCNMTQFAAYERQFRHCRIEALPPEGAARKYRVTRPIAAELGDDTPLTLLLQGAKLSDVHANGFECQHRDDPSGTILNLSHSDLQKIPIRISAVDNADNAPAPSVIAKPPEGSELSAWLCADLTTKELVLALQNSGSAALTDLRLTLRLPPLYADGVRRVDIPPLSAGEKRTLHWPLGEERSDPALHDGRAYFVAELDYHAGADGARVFATTRLAPTTAPRACLRDALKMFGPVDPTFEMSELQKQSATDAALADPGTTPDKKWFANSPDDRSRYDGECASLYRTDKGWRDAIAPFAVKPKWRFGLAMDFTLSEAAELKLTTDPPAKVQANYLNGQAPAAGEKLKGVAGNNRLILILETSDGRGIWSAKPLRIRLEPSGGKLEYKALPP